MRRSTLSDEFKPFEYKPWSYSSNWSLIDLYGDCEEEGLFGSKRMKKMKKDLSAPWVEAFVSDLKELGESRSPNDNIRIMLPEEEDEPEGK